MQACNIRFAHIVLFTHLIAGGCGGTNDPVACDPTAAHATSTKLFTVLAAGKHADGTVYVIDDTGNGQLRLFVSEGGVLVRQRVGGSGSSPDSITVSLTMPPLVVTAELSNAKVQRMAVVRGPIAGKMVDIPQEGDLLTLLNDDVVKKMPVRNLPGTVLVEHFGDSADGQRIVVTRPQDDWTYEDFKLYMGRPPNLLERKVRSVARGSWTDIFFDFDGKEAQAHFPSSLGGGEPFLKVGTNMMPMTVTQTSDITGLSFLCL